MTSHFIDLMARRATASDCARSSGSAPVPAGNLSSGTIEAAELSGAVEVDCTFCEIVGGVQGAYTVYEDEDVLAFLDILPIRPGHLLLVPKKHYERVTHLPSDVSASIGRVMPKIARAMCRAVEQPDFNVVSNQGYGQVVPHVHYHLVPAPSHHVSASAPLKGRKIYGRHELEDEEGEEIAGKIREELKKEGSPKL
ncbi:hypothetical protein JCM21900_002600 [Sporobolomyces salmonicolor]